MKRPLGFLSDFVLLEMPEALAYNSSDLYERVQSVVGGLIDGDVERVLNSNQRELAALDLKMLQASLALSGKEIPGRLIELVDLFSEGEIGGLTYEDVVLTNPVNDLRTFSCGEVYPTETLFYNEHRSIEERLGLVITDVQYLIRNQTPVLTLGQVEGELQQVTESTRRLARMPKGHFDQFRKYLNSVRDFKGPSGAYSARMPALELYCRGESLPQKYTDHLQHNWRYFPKRDRSLLENARATAKNGETLSAFAKNDLSDERKKMIPILEAFFDDFRKTHMGAVSRQVPKALKGEMEGTGGETNVKEFLEGRMRGPQG